jgi:hypothetical protein
MRRVVGFLAVLAILAAGCGGTSDPGAGGASIVPASATAFIELNTDLDSSQWQTVDELASRFPDKEKAVKALRDGIRKEGVDWEREVKPALGPEVDFVWLDFENDGQNFVVLVQPDDESKFKELLKKDTEAGEDFVAEEVAGWQVLAQSPGLIERFRRASGSDQALADKRAFVDAMDSYPEETLFRAFVDGKPIMDLVRRYAQPNERKMFAKFGSLDWIASDLHVTSEGVRFDANVHGTAGPALKGAMATRPFGPSLTREVPANALVFATFHGAKGMLTGLKNNPLFNEVPELRRYSDVLQGVESLLQGENAFYVRPGSGKIPEVTLVTEPAAGTNGVKTLDRILARYRSQLDLPSQPRPSRIAGGPARTIDFGLFKVHYANVGKRFVITDLPAGIAALKGNPPSLAQSDEYEGAVDASEMPGKTQGFFYVNVRGGVKYAERLAGSPLPGEIKRNLRPLRSVVEYASTRPSEVQLTFFLRIK